MSSQSSGAGRRRLNLSQKQYSAEDEALNIISNEAEARLAAKQAARAEAREIRLKELEKQQNESEVKQDNAAAKVRQQLSGSRSGSRRGSTESNDSDAKDTDFKAELRELEMKYKSAMVTSAQLDNEKQSLVYQVELLKDQLEEQNEEHTELQREYKEKCRQYDFQKRDLKSMEHELSILKQQLEIKDKLIEESGFVILTNEKGEPVIQKSSQTNSSNGPAGAMLVTAEIREVLRKAEGATLGTAMTDVNTNKSGVSSKAGTQERCLVTSSPVVDESDGAVLETVLLSEMCSGDNVREISEKPAGDVVLHDVISDECMSCKHESSRVEAVIGDNGDGVSVESGTRISNDDSSFTQDQVDVGELPQEKDISGLNSDDSVHTIPGSESYKDEVDIETDEVDEFFDAVSTPSPSSQTRTFVGQGVDSQSILTDDSEGTSVDPEITTEGDIIIAEKCPTYSSSDTQRVSIFVENVTESESSTDIKDEDDVSKENVLRTESSMVGLDEYESKINLQNVTETESCTDIICHNEENNNEDTAAEATKNEAENRDNINILETSKDELNVVVIVSSENVSSSEILEEEPLLENKTADNDKTDEEEETPPIDHNSENLPSCLVELRQDDATQHAEVEKTEDDATWHVEVEKTEDDATQHVEVEKTDDDATQHVEVEKTEDEATQHIRVEKTEYDATQHVGVEKTEDDATQHVGVEKIEDDATRHVEVEETEHGAEITQSAVCELQNSSSLNNPEVLDVPCTTDIVNEDTSEKHNDTDIVKEREDTESEVSKDGLNTESEIIKENEGNNLECTESQVGDPNEQTEDENNASINVQQAVDDNNEESEDGISFGQDASKIIMRKVSMGGSEASEGLGLDDYDLDDIDDILNTDVPSSVSTDELHTSPGTHAEPIVTKAIESVDQEDRSSLVSASDKDVVRKEETKTKDINKKSKEKVKTSKKEGKEKSKSSVKESKDKADKRKSKEIEVKDKTEKSKSNKKDDSQDKKTEKRKQSKKEADKTEAAGGEEVKHHLDESQLSMEPDDLEEALDKQMQESGRGKPHKKTSKKLSIFRKVFK